MEIVAISARNSSVPCFDLEDSCFMANIDPFVNLPNNHIKSTLTSGTQRLQVYAIVSSDSDLQKCQLTPNGDLFTKNGEFVTQPRLSTTLTISSTIVQHLGDQNIDILFFYIEQAQLRIINSSVEKHCGLFAPATVVSQPARANRSL
ncbi:hypothetical protein Hanom_Chr03g00231451 [Helianthus anomalus]